MGPVFEKGQIRFCYDMRHYMWLLLKRGDIGPYHGIEEVYMYFNWSGIWGGETMRAP